MAQLREAVVTERTASDHLEERLMAEVLFLKEQIQAEQCLKENLEETLQLEIEGCKEEIGRSLVPPGALRFNRLKGPPIVPPHGGWRPL